MVLIIFEFVRKIKILNDHNIILIKNDTIIKSNINPYHVEQTFNINRGIDYITYTML